MDAPIYSFKIENLNTKIQSISLLQREDDRVSKANELSLANVGGVFVVLLAGMGLACLIAVFEFIWKSRKLATEDNVRHSQLICKGFSHTSKHSFLISKSADLMSKSAAELTNADNHPSANAIIATTPSIVQFDYRVSPYSVVDCVLGNIEFMP